MGIDKNAAFGDFGPPVSRNKEETSFLFKKTIKLMGILPMFLFSIALVGATSFKGNTILWAGVFALSYIAYLKTIDGLRNANLRNQVEQGLQKMYSKDTKQ